jgi:hypothetical protein
MTLKLKDYNNYARFTPIGLKESPFGPSYSSLRAGL